MYYNEALYRIDKFIEIEEEKFQKIFDWADKYNISIPRDIESLKKITYIKLSLCRIKDLPKEIGSLKNLLRLTLDI